ncbi:MAG: hypothetical protein ACREDR_43660 [Blastocatellia bacterium]
MSLTLDLRPDLEDRIAREARSHGMTVEAYIQDVLERLIARLQEGSSALDGRVKVPLRSNGAKVTGRIIGAAPPPKDRSREFAWLSAHRDKYAGEWVALDGARLLAHGLDLKQVNSTARLAGINDALLIRVEPRDSPPYIGM